MSAKRPRVLGRARVGWPRALRELKDLLYEVYLAAGAPSLDEIAADVAADDGLAGAPERDTVRRCISDPSPPANQADAVSVATVLGRRAAWDEKDLAGRVRELWVRARMAQGVGWPIGEFTGDERRVLADLEIHPALAAGDAPVGRFGVLPAYVRREHDARLEEVVAAAADGGSGVAVLVGGSSTGKTRALWEAVRTLPEGWRLWHPISPSRPEATLANLDHVAPRTVVWLNEAQDYLGPDPLGEQAAAGLRSLLTDLSRAPVLVLATLWPEHWQTLTTGTGRHAHARQLLHGHKIDVPDEFAPTDLASLAGARGTDPRLVEAAERAQDAQVAQYLAGVPVLMERYETARGATRALIHAAMDARRLGAGPHIPLAWLADAAPGYLTDTEWNTTSDDWLTQALDYVTRECNGIPGILTPAKTTTRNQRNRRPTATNTLPSGPFVQRAQGLHYLLADYLDQYGRRHRADQIPPIDFWNAAAHHAHATDLATLGNAAWDRGLYRDAAQLHKHATTHGNPHAPSTLVDHLHALHPTDHRPAQWVAAHTALDDPASVGVLLDRLREVGAHEQVAVLAERAAAHVPYDNPLAVSRLLQSLREAGAHEQVAVLAERATGRAPLDDLVGVCGLLLSLREAGAHEQVAVLAERAVADVAPDDPVRTGLLLESLVAAEAHAQVAALLARKPAAHAALDNSLMLAWLLDSLREAGAHEQVAVLAERAAAHAPVDNQREVGRLLVSLREAGAHEQVAVLGERAAAYAPVDDAYEMSWLLDNLAHEQVAVLAERAVAHAPLDNSYAMGILLVSLGKVGAHEQVAVLAERTVARLPVDDPNLVGALLDKLREAGAHEQVAALLARSPAAHAALDNPSMVGWLLGSLEKVEADEQVAVLAERAAVHAPLDDAYQVRRLLDSLRDAGAHEHAAALLARNPAAHVALAVPGEVGRLLVSLREAGADEQVAVLAERAAAQAPLDNPLAVGQLLDSLGEVGAHEHASALLARNPAASVAVDGWHPVSMLLHSLGEAGGHEQIAVLAARLPAAGRFDQFTAVDGNRERFRLGREPDGSVAPSWMWDDLE